MEALIRSLIMSLMKKRITSRFRQPQEVLLSLKSFLNTKMNNQINLRSYKKMRIMMFKRILPTKAKILKNK